MKLNNYLVKNIPNLIYHGYAAAFYVRGYKDFDAIGIPTPLSKEEAKIVKDFLKNAEKDGK